MTRNKELYLPIALSMALTLVSGLLCGFLGGPWAALTGSGSVLLTTLLWMSTTWSRYKKLQELGEYLASVYAGGELLDIRDNREGELSLLKNDLHKITVTLRQQSAQLAHDKEFLQQLLGNISHQLRTPLTGMLVMADLLARSDLPLEKRQEFTLSLIHIYLTLAFTAVAFDDHHPLTLVAGDQAVADVFLQGGDVLRIEQAVQKLQPEDGFRGVGVVGHGEPVADDFRFSLHKFSVQKKRPVGEVNPVLSLIHISFLFPSLRFFASIRFLVFGFITENPNLPSALFARAK